MKTQSRYLRITALIASGFLALGALTACANPLEQLTQSGIENAIKDQIKQGTGVDVDFDFGSDASVPSSWPAVIPTPEGKLGSAMGSADLGWNLSYEVNDETALDRYMQQLEQAGFTVDQKTDVGGIKGAFASGHSYNIVVGYITADQQGTMTVTVVKGE